MVKHMGTVSDTLWSDFEAVTPPVDSVTYSRRLMMDGEECIAQEFLMIKPVVAGYSLPDGVFTSSSVYSASWLPHLARIDDYLISPLCAWLRHIDDTEPWLGITLPGNYIINMIKGCVILRDCNARAVTMATVTTCSDDVTWKDVAVGEDLSTRYGDGVAAYIWFSKSYYTR